MEKFVTAKNVEQCRRWDIVKNVRTIKTKRILIGEVNKMTKFQIEKFLNEFDERLKKEAIILDNREADLIYSNITVLIDRFLYELTKFDMKKCCLPPNKESNEVTK